MPHLKNLQVEHKKQVIADLEQTEREEINDFIISINFYLTRAFLVGVCLIFTIFGAAIYCVKISFFFFSFSLMSLSEHRPRKGHSL